MRCEEKEDVKESLQRHYWGPHLKKMIMNFKRDRFSLMGKGVKEGRNLNFIKGRFFFRLVHGKREKGELNSSSRGDYNEGSVETKPGVGLMNREKVVVGPIVWRS